MKSPHSYQASASVLLTLSPYEDSLTAAANNQAIAETSRWLGSPCNSWGYSKAPAASSTTYTATSVTDRLLTITASAPSPNQAVLRASAVASAFLKFRADELHGAAEPRAAVARTSRSTRLSNVSTQSTRRSASYQASPLQPRSSRKSANSGRNKPVRQPR